MGRLFPLFALFDVALIAIALIDCLSVEEHEIRALPRVVWVFLILLFSPVGPIVWFVAGRPQRAEARAARGPMTYARPSAQVPPDDDPEFIGRMATGRREDEELLRMWEADLRKREEELRRRENPDDRDD
jgi:Phospholipase_D-nuclease N-terminal